jgi:hypothetical protein
LLTAQDGRNRRSDFATFDRDSLPRSVRVLREIRVREGRPALFSKQFLPIRSPPERFLYFLPGPRAYFTRREENESGQENSFDRGYSRSGFDNSDHNLCNERLARRLARARFDQSSHGRHPPYAALPGLKQS